MTAPTLALVVPCHDEAARLEPDAFLRFAKSHDGVQLVFVDDGSGDGTWEILERTREAAPAMVTTVRLPSRRGKAEAVRAGVLAGLERQPALIGFFDADLSTPLEAIDDFLAVLRLRPAVEFVLGSRVMVMGRDIRRRAVRHYAGRVFATAASLALDLPVYDTQCGAKILRANAGTASLFTDPFHSPWAFDVELIARYMRLPIAPGEPERRDRLYELVLVAWHDRPGSKVRWHDFGRALIDVWHVWRERLAYRSSVGSRSSGSAAVR